MPNHNGNCTEAQKRASKSYRKNNEIKTIMLNLTATEKIALMERVKISHYPTFKAFVLDAVEKLLPPLPPQE